MLRVEHIRKNIKFLFVFILPVFFFIVQNSIQNKHTHFYANGIVVTHSHPLASKNGEPNKDHNHTKSEICFFHQVNLTYFTHTPQVEISQPPVISTITYFLFDDKKTTLFFYALPETRGPPSIYS